MNLNEMLTIKEAAKVASCSPAVLWHHVDNGHCKAIKFANVWGIKVGDLMAFVNARNAGRFTKAGRPKRKVEQVEYNHFGEAQLKLSMEGK